MKRIDKAQQMMEDAQRLMEAAHALMSSGSPEDELDGPTPAPVGKQLADGPDTPLWTMGPRGMEAAQDYYVRGRLGALKGALATHYAVAFTVVSLDAAYGRPMHTYVVKPDQSASFHNGVLTTPADLGWNRTGYFYDKLRPLGESRRMWLEAGCPTRDADGNPYAWGVPVPANQREWK